MSPFCPFLPFFLNKKGKKRARDVLPLSFLCVFYVREKEGAGRGESGTLGWDTIADLVHVFVVLSVFGFRFFGSCLVLFAAAPDDILVSRRSFSRDARPSALILSPLAGPRHDPTRALALTNRRCDGRTRA